MLTLSNISFLENCRILITGGTGSLGKKLTNMILRHSRSATVVIYSRDEFKQFQIQERLSVEEASRVRFFLGDVRDKDRLRRAMSGVDYVIHAAALKQVPAAEYNPFEFIKTNVIGAENVINACIDAGVRHVVALSTDKAANPINLYGATKLCSDKLFVSGNSYSGKAPTRFSVVRYGNVVGSRGSVIPLFLRKRGEGMLPITDERMTRFWITLDQGAAFVLNVLRTMQGGEIFVPKIPSMRVAELANVIAPGARRQVVGIRPGEKLHEVMVSVDDGRQTLDCGACYVIQPVMPFWTAEKAGLMGGQACPDGFYYGSDNNPWILNGAQIEKMIAEIDLPEARDWVSEKAKRGTT